MATSTRSPITGRSIPSFLAWVTRRRSMRRRTYPRPSFEGMTPSAMSAVVARACSDTIRMDTSIRSSCPYLRPDRRTAASTRGHVRSVS